MAGTNIVPIRQQPASVPAVMTWNKTQMSLIRRTVAQDCNEAEFDQFVHICKAVQLDPLRKQIYAFVFGKGDADKRRLTVVTGIDGYRSISARSGTYRPADKPPLIEYDDSKRDPLTNPLGIVRAEVTLYQFSHGQWHPVVAEAYWDEYAPIITEQEFDWVETGQTWPDGRPKKKKKPREGSEAISKLDPSKSGWIKSGRNMISKCAEAQAHRKGWPNDFAGTHIQEEIDRAHSIELTAWEQAEAGDQQDRLERIGPAKAISIDWMDGEPIQRVPVGKFYDAAMAFIRENMKQGEEQPSVIIQWRAKNQEGLREFWAYEKDAALQLKGELERIAAEAQDPSN
jgi:phage recombination protein Bet